MVRTRPQLGRRERRLVAGVGALAALIAAVVIASVALSSTRHVRGCVDATVPGPIGATEFHECGADARSLCRTLGPSGALSSYGVGVLADACRRAGLKVPAAVSR